MREIIGEDEIEEVIGYDDDYDDDDDDYYDDDDDDYDDDEVEALLGARMGRRSGFGAAMARRGARRGGRARRAPVRRRRRGGTSNIRRIAAAIKAVEGGTLLKRQQLVRSRHLVVGFVQLAIATTASANVTQRPQVLFRPQRIAIPASIAPNFTLTDIRVGNKSQLVSTGALPAETFSQTAFGVEMKMDTCQISMDLVLAVTNVSGAAADFRATIYGDSADV